MLDQVFMSGTFGQHFFVGGERVAKYNLLAEAADATPDLGMARVPDGYGSACTGPVGRCWCGLTYWMARTLLDTITESGRIRSMMVMRTAMRSAVSTKITLKGVLSAPCQIVRSWECLRPNPSCAAGTVPPDAPAFAASRGNWSSTPCV